MLIAAHGAVLGALLFALPLWAGLALALLLLCSLLYYLLRDAWLGLPTSCIGLIQEGEGAVLLRRDGTRLSCAILQDSLVMPYLTVLNVLPPESRFARSVVILADSMEAESFRQLRVWLRWGSAGRR